jgi:hypothetical protein
MIIPKTVKRQLHIKCEKKEQQRNPLAPAFSVILKLRSYFKTPITLTNTTVKRLFTKQQHHTTHPRTRTPASTIMSLNIIYTTEQYIVTVLFKTDDDVSLWMQQTTSLQKLMRFYTRNTGRIHICNAHFLTLWLKKFIAYQEEWGSHMVAPDLLMYGRS